MSSSNKTTNKILGIIEPTRAERFLLELANAKPINVGWSEKSGFSETERLRQRFPEMAEPLRIHTCATCESEKNAEWLWAQALTWIQLHLQRAWDAPDDRQREWYLFEMRLYYRDAVTVKTARDTGEPGVVTGISDEDFKDNFFGILRQRALADKTKLYLEPGDFFSALPMGGTPRQYVHPRFIEPPSITPFEAAAFYFQSRIGNRAKHCEYTNCPAPYFIAEKRWQKFCSEACAGPANREAKRKWWHNNRVKR